MEKGKKEGVVAVATGPEKPKYVTKSPLQKLVTSLEWDACMIVVIILNCVWIAVANPRIDDSEQPYYQKAGQNFFNVIFIAELLIKVAAFGLVKYWSDAWNWIDTIVVAEAIIGYIFDLIALLSKAAGGGTGLKSLSVIRFLRIMRLTRLLRPLKSIKMIPAVRIYIEAFGKSIESFFVNCILLFTTSMAIAYILNAVLDDCLQYRCVPVDFNSIAVLNNSYYQTYGAEYFYSSYNNVYCSTDTVYTQDDNFGGSRDDFYENELVMTGSSDQILCAEGFECRNINTADIQFFFPGAAADFSTIFNAFVSSFSFFTFRGWPHIYWALHDSVGIKTAFSVMVLIFSNAMLVVNLFPAIFLYALKTGNIERQKIKWLHLYPGNKRTVSEFELMIWANANMDLIHSQKSASTGGVMTLVGKFLICLIPCASWRDRARNSWNGKDNKKFSGRSHKEEDRDEEMDDGDKIKNTNNDNDNDNNEESEESPASGGGEVVGSTAEESKSNGLNTTPSLKDSAEYGGEMDPYELMEMETFKFYCVPRGRIFTKLRRNIFDESSGFNSFIMCCIVMNIAFMAFQSKLYPDGVNMVAYVSNIVFISVYICEAAFKLFVLGPFLYFDNPYNVFDLTLVLISVPSLVTSNGPFKIVNNFRILRMLRLARLVRLARLYRVVKNVYNTRDKSVHNTTITPGRLFGMILEFFTPMLNVMFLNMLVSFVFACLGMSLFGRMNVSADVYPNNSYVEAVYASRSYNGGVGNLDSAVMMDGSFSDVYVQHRELQTSNYTNTTVYVDTYGLPALESIFYAWGAKYTNRMNFYNFANAFITVYNYGVLNNWYHVMVNAIAHTKNGAFAYFFILLFFLYYVPQSTLLASVVSIMEVNANQALMALADDNEVVLRNVGYVNVRCHARLMIKKWQKNCQNSEDGSHAQHAQSGNTHKQRRPEVHEVVEVAGRADVVSEYLVNHENHTLFLFDEDHPFRRMCEYVLHSRVYAVIYLVAICVSVIPTILPAHTNAYTTAKQLDKINIVLIIVFSIDMMMRWVSDGFLAFFHYSKFLHHVDIVALGFELGAFFNTNVAKAVYYRILLLRLLKVPSLLQRSMTFLGVGATIHSINMSVGSIGSVMLISSVVGFFFAIIATQNFSLMFGHCSYEGYPAGASRYAVSNEFPNGCAGYAKVYDGETHTFTIIPIHWKHALDSFDDIFTSARSILRIMTFNEWQDLIYSSLDVVGVNDNQKLYWNRGAFIFFLIMGLVAGTFCFLSVAVIYYHYFIETAKANRAIIFGSSQAFWANYEERLRDMQNKTPVDALNRFCRANKLLKVAAVVYVILPYALFFTQANKFDDYSDHANVDSAFNIIFVAFAGLRILTVHRVKGLLTLGLFINICEIGIAVVLVFFLITRAGIAHNHDAVLKLVKIASLLRTFILMSFFEQLPSFFKIIWLSIVAFIPQVVFCIAILLVFSSLSFSFFHEITIDYSNTFLNNHYHFKSFMHALVTILGMGTGNYWTEVIDAVKRNQSVAFGIAVDAFFTLFYILFAALFRSFPLLVIYRYLVEAGGSSDIAIQQIKQFNHGWKKLMKQKQKTQLDFLTNLTKDNRRDDNSYTTTTKDENGNTITTTITADEINDEDVEVRRNVIARFFASIEAQVANTTQNVNNIMRDIQLTTAGRIKVDELRQLLTMMPPPLGIKGKTNSYLDQSKETRQVLLCMPRDGHGRVHNHSVNHHDAPLFQEKYLPEDMKVVMRALDQNDADIIKKELIGSAGSAQQIHVIDVVDHVFKHLAGGFSYTQVLIACHKRVVLSRQLRKSIGAEREMAMVRLRELRHRLALAMIANMKPVTVATHSHVADVPGADNDNANNNDDANNDTTKTSDDGNKNDNAAAVTRGPMPGYFQLVMLQRMDKQLYRKYFNAIIASHINSIQFRTNAYQISQFDTFFMGKLRMALEPEVSSAKLQLKLSQLLATPGCSEHVIRRRDLTRAHCRKLRALKAQMDDLYNMNANNIWNIGSFTEACCVGGKVGVTSLAVDAKSTIYAGFDNADLKIYCTRKAENLGRAVFTVQQKMQLEKEARCLYVSQDGRVLMAGVGVDIIVFGWKSKRRAGRPQFTEVHRFSQHYDITNVILSHGPFNISAGQDGYVMLWDMNSASYIKYYNAGSPVYCATHVICANDLTSPEMVGVLDFTVYGCKNGSVVLLPLPSTKGNSSELATPFWPSEVRSTAAEVASSINLMASSIAVTALRVCWGYLFVGLADGSVQTWSFTINKDISYELVGMQFIKKVDMVRVSNVAWHAGPVTSIQYTGGYMFTASYDYSILPWERPEKPNVTQPVQYSQKTLSGLVYHTAAITAMASNRFQIVSADQDGKIIITVPRVITDVPTLGASSALFEPDVTKYMHFSFLVYDFGPCFIKHQKIVMRERVVLTVTNTYTQPLDFQVTATKLCPQFEFLFDHNINPAGFQQQVQTSKTSKHVSFIRIKPFQSLNFTIAFTPEDEAAYQTTFEFLVDSKKPVAVNVKGVGVRPVLLVNGSRMLDFGSCIAKSGGRKKLSLTLENPTPKDILVNRLDVEEDFVNFTHLHNRHKSEDKEDPKYEVYDGNLDYVSLKHRDITITPECFILKGNGSITLALSFRPEREYFPFEIDVRMQFCGAAITVAKCLGRSEERSGTSAKAVSERPMHEKQLRPLHPTETVLMVTKGPVLAYALRDINWVLMEDDVQSFVDQTSGKPKKKQKEEEGAGNSTDPADKVVVLMHRTSGVFIEFPPDYYFKLRQPQFSTIDRFRIKFSNKTDSFYYIRMKHGGTEIDITDQQEGGDFSFTPAKFAQFKIAKFLKKPVHEIFVRNKKDARQEGNPDLVGFSVIEVSICTEEKVKKEYQEGHAAGKDFFEEAHTIRTYFVRVQRGFRIQKTNQYDTDDVSLADRINVIGVEKVITSRRVKKDGHWSEVVEITELFGRTLDDNADEYNGNAMFGKVIATVRNKAHTLHSCTVIDQVHSPGKIRPMTLPPEKGVPAAPGATFAKEFHDDQKPTVALQYTETRPLISSTETELITIQRPKYMLRATSLTEHYLKTSEPTELHEVNGSFSRTLGVKFVDEEIVPDDIESGAVAGGGDDAGSKRRMNSGRSSNRSFLRSKSTIGKLERSKTISRTKSSAVGRSISTRDGGMGGDGDEDGANKPLTQAELAQQTQKLAKDKEKEAIKRHFENFMVDLHVAIDVEHRAMTTKLAVLDVLPRQLATPEYVIDFGVLESIPHDMAVERDNVDEENKDEGDDPLNPKYMENFRSDNDPEERERMKFSDGLPNRALARKVEDLVDRMRRPSTELDVDCTTPTFYGNWFFVLDGGTLKLVSANPRADTPELDPTELYLLEYGFNLSPCSGGGKGILPETKVIGRDFFVVPVEDPEESYKLSVINYCGTAGVPAPPPHFMTNIFEIKAKEEVQSIVKNYFKGLAKRRVDAKVSVAQKEYDRKIAEFDRKKELEVAKRPNKRPLPEDNKQRNAAIEQFKNEKDKTPTEASFKEIYEEILGLVGSESSRGEGGEGSGAAGSGAGAAAGAGGADAAGAPGGGAGGAGASSAGGGGWFSGLTSLVTAGASEATKVGGNRATQLEFDAFVNYLQREKDVSGIDRAFTKGQAIYILEDLRPQIGIHISLDVFEKWYNAAAATELSNSLTTESMFALLLHEKMTRRERTHINKRGIGYEKRAKEVVKELSNVFQAGAGNAVATIMELDTEVVSENEAPSEDKRNSNKRSSSGRLDSNRSLGSGGGDGEEGGGQKETLADRIRRNTIGTLANLKGILKKSRDTNDDNAEDAAVGGDSANEESGEDGAGGQKKKGGVMKKLKAVAFRSFRRTSSTLSASAVGAAAAPGKGARGDEEEEQSKISPDGGSRWVGNDSNNNNGMSRSRSADDEDGVNVYSSSTRANTFANAKPSFYRPLRGGETTDDDGLLVPPPPGEGYGESLDYDPDFPPPMPNGGGGQGNNNNNSSSSASAAHDYHASETESGMYRFFGSKKLAKMTAVAPPAPAPTAAGKKGKGGGEYELGVMGGTQHQQRAEVLDIYSSVE